MMKYHLCWAALPMLAVAQPAFAQSPQRYFDRCFENGGCMQGTTIIVEGAAFADPLGDDAYSIDAIKLQDGPTDRLEAALSNIAGLQQFRRSDARSANPTSQGITMRGMGGNASSRTALILDGVPQADPFGGWVSWPGYDAVPILEARVRRGGGTGADGPGALAGTVELFTNSIDRLSQLGVAYGSRNSVEARGSLMRILGQGRFTVGASYARSDGFIPIIQNQRGLADRSAPYQQGGLAMRAVLPLNDSLDIQTSLRGFIDERERGVDFTDNRNSGVDASVRLVGSGDDLRWALLGYVQLRDFSSGFASVSTGRASASPTVDQYSVPSTGLGARFEIRSGIGENGQIRVGADWRRTIGETQENFFFTGIIPGRGRNAGGRTDNYGAFVEGSWTVSDTLILTGGGRFDRWNIANGFFKEFNLSDGSVRTANDFADRSGSEWTGRAGFAWQPLADSGSWTLRGAAYTGWRLPTLNELYRPFRVGTDATAANAGLSPEKMAGAEIGVEYEDEDDFSFSLTGFWNRLNDAIANVTLAQGPGNFPGVGFVAVGGRYNQRRNLDTITSKGVELDASYDLTDELGFNFGYESFMLRAGYAYVDAKVGADGMASALNGLRPAQAPKHFANFSLDFVSREERSAGLSLRYTGSQYEDDLNSQRLQNAFTLDAHLGFFVMDNLELELRGENLFNAQVQTAISGAGVIERATPRTIWLSLGWKFD